MYMGSHNKLDDVVSITVLMLEAAKAEDWARVIVLEEERHTLMITAFSGAPDTDKKEQLEKLIMLNEELTELSDMEKTTCSNQFTNNKNNKKAFQAYSAR